MPRPVRQTSKGSSVVDSLPTPNFRDFDAANAEANLAPIITRRCTRLCQQGHDHASLVWLKTSSAHKYCSSPCGTYSSCMISGALCMPPTQICCADVPNTSKASPKIDTFVDRHCSRREIEQHHLLHETNACCNFVDRWIDSSKFSRQLYRFCCSPEQDN